MCVFSMFACMLTTIMAVWNEHKNATKGTVKDSTSTPFTE